MDKFHSPEYILKLKLNKKHVQNNHNDCDNHLIITNLNNKVGVQLLKDFDSLKDELFDGLRSIERD